MKTAKELYIIEQKKLEKYLEKKEALNLKIKTCKINMEKYKTLMDIQKYEKITAAMDAKGIEFNDVIKALRDGDMSFLQNKINTTNTDETIKQD